MAYCNTMLIAKDHEFVYDGIRGGGFEYLELVEVGGSCSICVKLYVDSPGVAQFFC